MDKYDYIIADEKKNKQGESFKGKHLFPWIIILYLMFFDIFLRNLEVIIKKQIFLM